MRYHELLARTLAGCARARFSYDYYTSLSEIHEDTRRAITTDTARSAATPKLEGHQRYAKGKNRVKGNKTKGNAQKGTMGEKRSKAAGADGWMAMVLLQSPPPLSPAAGK